MAQLWYYVQDSERVGPVSKDELGELIQTKKIDAQTYVWTKGFADWVHLEDIEEFSSYLQEKVEEVPPVKTQDMQDIEEEVEEKFEEIESLGLEEEPLLEPVEEESFEDRRDYLLKDLVEDQASFYIRVGEDRDSLEVDYGPFNLEDLKKLFHEKRINEKTFIYGKGLVYWVALGDFKDFEEVFSSKKTMDLEKRRNYRKPFVARMFLSHQEEVFEGLCRDISVGGMQILLDSYPGVPGDFININVHPDNSDYHFVARGEVVRILEGKKGFSFRFKELSEGAKEAIEKYLEQESQG